MTRELLRQVRVLDPMAETDRVADVAIASGKIQAIEARITDWPSEAPERDCRGMVLGPGLVDLYSHSGEPGFETRETLTSLRRAATAGGFTRLAILPETQPVLETPADLGWRKTAVSRPIDATVNGLLAPPTAQCYFWGALTRGLQGQQMLELGELAAAGVVGFTDGRPLPATGLLRRLLEYLQPLNRPVALWPCDAVLAAGGVMREGVESMRLGLAGNPAIAETAALAALLECIEAIGTPVHLMRISTARSVELIQAAKKRGLPITASTSWMHVLLDCEEIGCDRWQKQPYNPNLRLAPPLGSRADRFALMQGLRDGTLDAIAIDHTPYTYEEKTVAFAEAPPGAIGLELALPLLWHGLVETEQWSALELWRCLSNRPARCLGQAPAQVAVGQPAELTLFAPQQPWPIDPQSLNSLASNTPWLGQQLVGRVVQTWLSE